MASSKVSPLGRLKNAVFPGSRYRSFAHANGLIYFGHVSAKDEHKPVQGFTVTNTQTDAHYVSGTVNGRELTMVRRSVPPRKDKKAKAHTWLIAQVPHAVQNGPHVLLLSHEHPRDVVEAAYLHADRAEHVALDYRLDATFLIFAQRDDAERMKQELHPGLIELLCSHTAFDYEFEAGCLYIYQRADANELSPLRLMQTALAVAESYEKSPA